MIRESDDAPIDFSRIYYIGHVLLHYTDKEVGRKTLGWIMELYQHYKDTFDQEMMMFHSRMTYAELQFKEDHRGELMPS